MDICQCVKNQKNCMKKSQCVDFSQELNVICDSLTFVTNLTYCEYGTVIGYELRGVRLKCDDLRLK